MTIIIKSQKSLNMTDLKFYEELKILREKDKYPSKELKEHLINKIFPKTRGVSFSSFQRYGKFLWTYFKTHRPAVWLGYSRFYF
jgi:hypothetical protein